MYMFSVASVIWGYHEYKDIWSEGFGIFASVSASGDRKIVISAPQVSTHTRAKFLSWNQEFYKNRDKFGWVKILANDIQFAKFVRVFPHHNFSLYGISVSEIDVVRNQRGKDNNCLNHWVSIKPRNW